MRKISDPTTPRARSDNDASTVAASPSLPTRSMRASIARRRSAESAGRRRSRLAGERPRRARRCGGDCRSPSARRRDCTAECIARPGRQTPGEQIGVQAAGPASVVAAGRVRPLPTRSATPGSQRCKSACLVDRLRKTVDGVAAGRTGLAAKLVEAIAAFVFQTARAGRGRDRRRDQPACRERAEPAVLRGGGGRRGPSMETCESPQEASAASRAANPNSARIALAYISATAPLPPAQRGEDPHLRPYERASTVSMTGRPSSDRAGRCGRRWRRRRPRTAPPRPSTVRFSPTTVATAPPLIPSTVKAPVAVPARETAAKM